MKQISFICALVLLLSCKKSGSNPIPDQPLPPVDSTQAPSHLNFGKLFFLTDTFRVYDANTGKLQIYSGPVGSLFNAGVNNTTVDRDLVYQPTRDGLLALNSTTGNVRFVKYFYLGHTGSVSTCYPIINGNRLFQCFFNYNGSALYCLNKRTGDTIWQTHTYITSDTQDFFPAIDETSQNIIVTTVHGPACFSKATGQLVWENSSSPDYGKFFAAPRVCNENLVVFFASNNRGMYAFDAANGNFLWKTDFSSLGYTRSSRAHYYNNKIYVTFLYGSDFYHGMSVVSFNSSTGQMIDKFTNPFAITAIGYYDKYYYVFDDTTVVGSPIRLSKHSLSDGSTIWAQTINGQYGYVVVLTPGFIYYSSTTSSNSLDPKTMNILDQVKGSMLRQYPVYTNLSFSPTVVDSTGRAYNQIR